MYSDSVIDFYYPQVKLGRIMSKIVRSRKMNYVRNSARAILIKDDCIAITKNQEVYGEAYYLPGGGQEFGEDLETTLRRECIEEIGLGVNVLQCAFIREYIGEKQAYHEYDMNIHQVEFYFICTLDYETLPTSIDKRQIEWFWAPIDNLSQYEKNFFPKSLIPFIQNKQFSQTIYLGSDI